MKLLIASVGAVNFAIAAYHASAGNASWLVGLAVFSGSLITLLEIGNGK